MKTYMKFLSILPVAVMFIATTFASSALASPPPLTINGLIEASEVHVHQPGILGILDVDGGGHASVLGRYAMHEVATVVMVDNSSGSAVGTADIIAANGDHIFTNVDEHVTWNQDITAGTIVETQTITGGTGRFAGATGTIAINRVLDLATMLSIGTITGTITLP